MTLPKTLLSPLATKDMFLFALSGMNFSEISLGMTNNFCCHYCDKRNQLDFEVDSRFRNLFSLSVIHMHGTV